MFFHTLTTALFCHLNSKRFYSKAITTKLSHSKLTVHSIASSMTKFSYINCTVAKAIDESLMHQPGFTLDQLMELAGLAVAQAAHIYAESLRQRYQLVSEPSKKQRRYEQPPDEQRRILVLCGPGNNGGDGLVAARHLYHFGYHPTICYPKPGKDQIFTNLVKQCRDLEIPFITDSEFIQRYSNPLELTNAYEMIVDALFGFSFEGPPREPFSSLINIMAQQLQELEMQSKSDASKFIDISSPSLMLSNNTDTANGFTASFNSPVCATRVPVLSVDVPSGWHVEEGDKYKTGFKPSAVISLTLPKECMRGYSGNHYLGGRFLPPRIAREFGVTTPDYGFGSLQVIKISTD